MRNTTTYITAYPDFVAYPDKFPKPLLLLLGEKRFLFAGFSGMQVQVPNMIKKEKQKTKKKKQ